MKLFEYINGRTGFGDRELFQTTSEVREYFTMKHMEYMFGEDHGLTQEELDEMAQLVIQKKWNMKEEKSKVFSVRINRSDSREEMDQKIIVLRGKIERFRE